MPFNIFVTGTSRGLGRELVKILVKEHPDCHIFVQSRADPHQSSKKWEEEIGPNKLQCFQFDINSSEAIAKTAEGFKQQGIRFDRVVANAGVGSDHSGNIPTVEAATNVLNVNLVQTIEFIKHFLPLLSEKGRFVIVSSLFAQLNVFSEELRNKLLNPNITEAEIMQLAQDYIAACEKKDLGIFHWMVYRVSKALLNTWSRKHLKEGQEYIAMHPGWCKTDMGGEQAPLTAHEGGRLINDCIWLKDVDHDRFYNGQFVSFVECEPVEKQ